MFWRTFQARLLQLFTVCLQARAWAFLLNFGPEGERCDALHY